MSVDDLGRLECAQGAGLRLHGGSSPVPCGARTSRSPLLVGSPLQVSHHMPVGCTFSRCLKLSPATETALQFLQNHTETPTLIAEQCAPRWADPAAPTACSPYRELGSLFSASFPAEPFTGNTAPCPHSLLAKWRAPKGLLIPAAKKKVCPQPMVAPVAPSSATAPGAPLQPPSAASHRP